MKWVKIICICILLIISFVSNVQPEVIGEYSYNVCLDKCRRDAKARSDIISHDYQCYADAECAECLDACLNELRKNNADIADKLNKIDIVDSTPTSCFINTLRSIL